MIISNKEKQIIKKVFEQTKNEHIIIIDKINRFWFTNFQASRGILIISKQHNTKIFLDERYFYEGEKNIKNAEVLSLKEFPKFFKKLQGTMLFENNLPYFWYEFFLKKQNSKLKLKSHDITSWRVIKESWEINKIRNICQLTKNIWPKIINYTKQQRSEIEVEKFIIEQFFKVNVKELAFESIVTSDERSAFIHTKPTKAIIKNNLLCDFGGKLDGYCADFSRNLILNKESKLNNYLKILRILQAKLIAEIKPGIKFKVLNKITKEFYKKHKLTLPHALGHGIGLEVHEHPALSDELILQPNMVFTIEPGIYINELGGIRVEDVILVTKDGCEVLTK